MCCSECFEYGRRYNVFGIVMCKAGKTAGVKPLTSFAKDYEEFKHENRATQSLKQKDRYDPKHSFLSYINICSLRHKPKFELTFRNKTILPPRIRQITDSISTIQPRIFDLPHVDENVSKIARLINASNTVHDGRLPKTVVKRPRPLSLPRYRPQIERKREAAMMCCSFLGTEDLVGRLAGKLKDKIDLLLNYLPGRVGGECH
jgi:hypothetical protein